MANIQRTLLSFETHDLELLSQLEYIKSNFDLENEKLHELVDTIGLIALSPPSEQNELKTLKNRARLLEMEVRGGNSLLSSLTEEQRKALCDPASPINAIGTAKVNLASGANGSVSSLDIAGKTYAVKKSWRENSVLNDYLVGKEISHPHIVKTLMYVEKVTGAYLFLDYIPGETFESISDIGQKVNLPRDIGHIASAILYLDSKLKVHLDLHRKNMMFTENGGYMIDLGAIKPQSTCTLKDCASYFGSKFCYLLNDFENYPDKKSLSDLKQKGIKLQNCTTDDEARLLLNSMAQPTNLK